MAETKIEWTNKTWNPVRGCSVISEGCKNCYAMKMAHRFSGEGQAYEGLTVATKNGGVWNGTVKLVHEKLDEPLRWRKPSMVFVNSMSDLFHEDVPFEFTEKVWDTMFDCLIKGIGHIFQFLTKRPDRMLAFAEWMRDTRFRKIDYPNVWLGVSVENQHWADIRIPQLLQTPAAVRFLSVEPLLGAVDLRNYFAHWQCDRCGERWYNPELPLESVPCGCGVGAGKWYVNNGVNRVNWVIVGGESGKGARPMHPDWVRRIRDDCDEVGVPFFFKQWGDWFPRSQWEGNPELVLPDDSYVAAYDYNEHVKADKKLFVFPKTDDYDYEPVHRVGKKAAGAMLDGRDWTKAR